MAMVTWTPKMSVGVAKIDKEHQGLFEIMNKLHDNMLQGRGKDVLAASLASLVQYTRVHFGGEEELLRRHGYPGLADHIKLHEVFRKRVADLDGELKTGNAAVTMATLDFLRDWLVKHIQGIDMQYKGFLASKGVS